MKFSSVFYIEIVAAFYLLSINTVNAQVYSSSELQDTVNQFRVVWVKEIPDIRNQKKTKLHSRLLNIFLGENNKPGLSKPISVVARNPGLLWILDQGNRMIYSTESNSGQIVEIKNTGRINLPSLVGICFAPDNKILFTDSRLNKIFQITRDDKEPVSLNDSLILKQPTGIAYSTKKDEIWVVETAAHRISVLNKEGHLIKTIGHRGTGPEGFNYPTFIWIDSSGYVYITDAMNFRVKVYDIEGEIISIFGKSGDASGYFASPKGIASDSRGHIFVVDALFHTIQVFNISGELLYYFGKQGHGKGEFWMPSGIFIDKNDFIYIADSYNSRIQVFQLKKIK